MDGVEEHRRRRPDVGAFGDEAGPPVIDDLECRRVEIDASSARAGLDGCFDCGPAG